MRIFKPSLIWTINIICVVVGVGLQDLYSSDTLDLEHIINLIKFALITASVFLLGSAILVYAYSKLRPLPAETSIEWYLSPVTWIGGVTILCILIFQIST
ncbi:hypothetical protein BTA51_13400 [Hahella sp. CCB-MM4]|uniref:hypothetical protein n=1 Tax=Hahella sp. (strain CCB-MM4) TaxID=1926491 RepID=UPI000B9B732C|nr:hypothetical protein [Hahella sp. CCB-MM4]OZG72950.1 hypothetical protein BTA51_13400 [Hahella sp. CCB-MM4]